MPFGLLEPYPPSWTTAKFITLPHAQNIGVDLAFWKGRETAVRMPITGPTV